MNIGKIIRKLRISMNLTQEALAEMLGVSSRAVSQWETEKTFPDISLLPILSNIFEVSSDVLLGIDIDNKEKKIAKVLKESSDYSSIGLLTEAINILEEGLKLYPNNYEIMSHLSSNIWLDAISHNNEGKEIKLQKAAELGEKVLEKCTNDDIRHNTIQVLTYIYSELNEYEKAEELALKMPFLGSSRQMLLENIYTGTKRFEQKRRNQFDLIDAILTGFVYNNAPLDDNNLPYDSKESLLLCKKSLQLLKLFFEDENYGFYFDRLFTIYKISAWHNVILRNYQDAINDLKEALRCAKKFDFDYSADKEYSCLLFKGMKYGTYSTNNNANLCSQLVDYFENKSFDDIRNDEDFDKLYKEAKEKANLRCKKEV